MFLHKISKFTLLHGRFAAILRYRNTGTNPALGGRQCLRVGKPDRRFGCLHWMKDREYEEDKHVLDVPCGKAWTILTNIAVSLTNLLRCGERTLAGGAGKVPRQSSPNCQTTRIQENLLAAW